MNRTVKPTGYYPFETKTEMQYFWCV
jgi:hypothetical protein